MEDDVARGGISAMYWYKLFKGSICNFRLGRDLLLSLLVEEEAKDHGGTGMMYCRGAPRLPIFLEEDLSVFLDLLDPFLSLFSMDQKTLSSSSFSCSPSIIDPPTLLLFLFVAEIFFPDPFLLPFLLPFFANYP